MRSKEVLMLVKQAITRLKNQAKKFKIGVSKSTVWYIVKKQELTGDSFYNLNGEEKSLCNCSPYQEHSPG